MKTGSHRIVGRARANELQIPAGDGRLLGATMFAPAEPSGQEHPVTVLASATGVKRGFYDAYALYLAEGGLHAITFDYRGIGGSRSGALGSFRATAREWGELDLDGVLSWAMARFPGERVGILGHSIGGQLVGLAARAADADRVLMISAQSGYWPLFNAPLKYLYALPEKTVSASLVLGSGLHAALAHHYEQLLIGRQPYHSSCTSVPTGSRRYSAAPRLSASRRSRFKLAS